MVFVNSRVDLWYSCGCVVVCFLFYYCLMDVFVWLSCVLGAGYVLFGCVGCASLFSNFLVIYVRVLFVADLNCLACIVL